MALTSIRLPDHLVRELDQIAARRRATRSDLVREAVAQYCEAARSNDEADPVALVERYLREMFRGRRRRRPR